MDLSQMSDDDLMGLYQQGVRKQQTGFVAPAAAAPTKIAAQQEYQTAIKALQGDQDAYKRVGPLRDQLSQFEQANERVGTGGFMQQVPGLSTAYANMKGGDLSNLASLGSAMQVNDIPKGQGAVSNFERSLYGAGQPGIDKQGPVNQDIIHRKLALFNQEGDRLGFMQSYLAANGRIAGAQDAWDKYVQANPYSKSDPKGRVAVNTDRTPWKEYFGLTPSAPVSKRDANNQQLKAKSAASKGFQILGVE